MTPEERKRKQEQEERHRKRQEWDEWMGAVSQADQDIERLDLKPSELDFKKHFVEHEGVRAKLEELQKQCAGKRFSDIVDAEGHQYVDLVMEGGGTLGIALLGYIHALESVGLRFLSIAGTSAGSITALLLAAASEDKREEKAEELFHMLSVLDLSTILDSRFPANRFIRAVQRRVPKADGNPRWGSRLKRRMKSFSLGLSRVQWGLWSSPGLLRRLGLNPGELLLKRVQGILKAHGVETARDLNERMASLPEDLLEQRTPGQTSKPFKPPEGKRPRLALIASEVSTGTKVVFPRMARYFWKEPDGVNPAYFVRASMSVPFFFHPLRRPPDEMPRLDDEWNELVGYDGGTPVDSCMLVDGGLMSNFPISEFHSAAIPRTPTFGVKLGLEKRVRIDTAPTPEAARRGIRRLLPRGPDARPLGQFSAALFDSARQTLDEDFIEKNPDYKKLITYIDTNGHDWLKFNLSAKEQVDLFLRGVAAGAIFLKHFDWPEYKQVRERLYQAQLVGFDGGDEAGDGERAEEPSRTPPGGPGGVGDDLTPPATPPA